MENNPRHWKKKFPRRTAKSHKYDFGHALIAGARTLTGATRLAAESCARIGAGLTTVVADGDVSWLYRATLSAHIMVEDSDGEFHKHLGDERRNACLIGPGAGPDFSATHKQVMAICQTKRKVVIDADALNALAEKQEYDFLHPDCVLTPHEGEFAKLFPDLSGKKGERALAAAKQVNAIVVLKGEGTVIAAPDGRVAINKNAPPALATAGTGDVLAGMITGLLAQGMEPFDAACAAVWIHGECGTRFGAGLVASDLQSLIPIVLKDLAF